MRWWGVVRRRRLWVCGVRRASSPRRAQHLLVPPVNLARAHLVVVEYIFLLFSFARAADERADAQREVAKHVVDVQTIPQLAGLGFDVRVPAHDGEFGRERDAEVELDPFDVCQRHFGFRRQPEVQVQEGFGAFEAFAEDVEVEVGGLLEVALKEGDLV